MARSDGTSPLFVASQEGHLKVARLLLRANADKDKAAGNGATSLVMASQQGQGQQQCCNSWQTVQSES